jgi:sarcosine oxidase
MTETFDVIVLGVGGMGSATVYELARKGQKVLGLEQFDIPHDRGSSHGLTRIIRLAYYEHPSYVPLLRRAYELWRELESHASERLLSITGAIDAGPEGGGLFEGSLLSCQEHDLPHEVMTGLELGKRYPGYRLPASIHVLLQPDGGFLRSEPCIVAFVEAAHALGADIRAREKVLDWRSDGEKVTVTTGRGAYEAAALVIAAGAWAGKVVPELAPHAHPERQVLAWFQPRRPELFQPSTFPVFNLLVEEGRYYGFPVHGVPGFKVGRYHHLGEAADPDALNRDCSARDEEVLRTFTARYMPEAAGPTMALRTCMFTNTPDEHFVLDLHPEHKNVSVAAGFSGHGFKFCSVVGEIMADLAVHRQTPYDIRMFRLARFGERPLPASPGATGG